MSRLFGDSKPFPHDLDYLKLAEASFDCAVELVAVEQQIRDIAQELKLASAAEKEEKAAISDVLRQLENVGESQRDSYFPQVESMKSQALDAIRKIGVRSNSELTSEVARRKTSAEGAVRGAQAAGTPAIETLLRSHTPIDTSLELHLKCLPGERLVLNSLTTPFGLEAQFAAALPQENRWANSPKVSDFARDVEIEVTRRIGWFSKRLQQVGVRLDGYYVTDLRVEKHGGSFRLRKSLKANAGFELFLNSEAKVPVAAQIVENGNSKRLNSTFPLQGQAAASVRSLYQSMADSTAELRALRADLVSASYEDQALDELPSPLPLAKALIEDMAPLVVEISRRSNAPGELILRRTIDDRSREESYITKAELRNKLLALPTELRQVFEPLRLDSTAEKVQPPIALSRQVHPPCRPPRTSTQAAKQRKVIVESVTSL